MQDTSNDPNATEAKAESNDQELGLVQRLSPKLTGAQRQHLRALGHHLNPIVLIGQNGISEGLIQNFEAALLAHELVKVKTHDADEVERNAQALYDATGAQLAQKIGKVLLFFRAHPSQPKIVLPKKTTKPSTPAPGQKRKQR